jgi:integrase
MAMKRKAPKLQFTGRYYVVNVYRPDGGRTTISFGPVGERTEGQIYVAFGKWLDLFNQHPHKVLTFDSPYAAIEGMTNPQRVLTIGELLAEYRAWAEKRKTSVRGDKQHPALRFITRVERFLAPYASWPITGFGPDELEAVREAMIEYQYACGKEGDKATLKHYTRRGINDSIKWIHTIWDWGHGRHFVPHSYVQGLKEVRPLKMGDSRTVDNSRRLRVTDEEFWKVIPETSKVIGDMLQLIWYTAMRPYEVCDMRPFDILTDDADCWLYIPGRDRTPVGKHKTTHFERVKVVPLTRKCQLILKSRIKKWNSKEYIFSPEEGMAEFLAKKAKNRKTPLSCGNRPGTNRKEHPLIKPGNSYDANALANALARACKRAGVDKIRPYDLRRTKATGIRSILGKEAAKVLLGHTRTTTTDIYLLDEVQEAVKVAKQLADKLEQEDDTTS